MADCYYVGVRSSTNERLAKLLTEALPDYELIKDQIAKVLAKHPNHGPRIEILEVPADIGKLLNTMAYVISEWEKAVPAIRQLNEIAGERNSMRLNGLMPTDWMLEQPK